MHGIEAWANTVENSDCQLPIGERENSCGWSTAESAIIDRCRLRIVFRDENRGNMPIGSEDLHGNVPDRAGVALLLIDVINDFEYPDGEQLLRLALPVGEHIAALKKLAKDVGIPSIYVNDNFGKKAIQRR